MYYHEDGICEFVRDNEVISCDDPKLFQYTLIPLDKLDELDMKFGRCESWR